jgi:hypothetical protein
MKNGNKVFLSYSSADRGFCRRLAHELERHGLVVWWDFDAMKVGESISESIRDAIEKCDWFAVILSPSALASHWVGKELSLALESETNRPGALHVLPVLHLDCRPPDCLANRAHADFRHSYEDGLQILLKRIGSPITVRFKTMLLSEDEQQIRSVWSRLSSEDRSFYRSWLTGEMRSQDSTKRRAAAMALWKVKDPEAPFELTQLLGDPSTSVLRMALLFAGESKSQFLTPTIAPLLSHKDPGVRQAARQAYQQINGKKR